MRWCIDPFHPSRLDWNGWMDACAWRPAGLFVVLRQEERKGAGGNLGGL